MTRMSTCHQTQQHDNPSSTNLCIHEEKQTTRKKERRKDERKKMRKTGRRDQRKRLEESKKKGYSQMKNDQSREKGVVCSTCLPSYSTVERQ